MVISTSFGSAPGGHGKPSSVVTEHNLASLIGLKELLGVALHLRIRSVGRRKMQQLDALGRRKPGCSPVRMFVGRVVVTGYVGDQRHEA